jgi:hypothetical protein
MMEEEELSESLKMEALLWWLLMLEAKWLCSSES